MLKHSNEKVHFDYRRMYKMSRTAWRKAIRTCGSTVYLLPGKDGPLSGRMVWLYQDKEKVDLVNPLFQKDKMKSRTTNPPDFLRVEKSCFRSQVYAPDSLS